MILTGLAIAYGAGAIGFEVTLLKRRWKRRHKINMEDIKDSSIVSALWPLYVVGILPRNKQKLLR